MMQNKLARGMVEIPKGVNTSHSENSNFMSKLDRTNALLMQFLSSADDKKTLLRTELEESYFNLTMYNLKDSLKHKIEQDMWNNLFKKHVSELQGKLKSKDKAEIVKGQSELSMFLDESIGFYSKFLDVLSLIYGLKLPGGRICGDGADTGAMKAEEGVTEQDLRYVVQHCFVHLGDLSRYHNLHKLARLNYRWAVQLDPGSGHPYNQLAILESAAISQTLNHSNYSRLLHTLLYYDYAGTCSTPFPATQINLDSLLRHVHQESVSELLTSNSNCVGAEHCVSSLSMAWLHAYAAMRLRSNVPRCRQLQQRVVEWAADLVKHADAGRAHWRDLVTVAALQCALLSPPTTTPSKQPPAADNTEAALWRQNTEQFTQDLLDSLCHGLVSLSHDEAFLVPVLTEPGCLSVLVVVLCWLCQHLSSPATPLIRVPFGAHVVALLNVLAARTDAPQAPADTDAAPPLPLRLPELIYLQGYEPLKVPCPQYPLLRAQPLPAAPLHGCRASFLVSVARRAAQTHGHLIAVCGRTSTFLAVPPPPPPVPEPQAPLAVVTRRPLRPEPSVPRRAHNVALASFKTAASTAATAAAVVTDVQIARYIQEHLGALDNRSSSSVLAPTPASPHGPSREDVAPAPGLILSSSLPPDFHKAAAVVTAVATEAPPPPANHANTPPPQPPHSYNPNREQFEKDLPPRFANKRGGGGGGGSGQKEGAPPGGSGGGLNYWERQEETNLTRKESEMVLMMPPPPSWLNEEQHQHQHQQRTMYQQNPLQQSPVSMLPPSMFAPQLQRQQSQGGGPQYPHQFQHDHANYGPMFLPPQHQHQHQQQSSQHQQQRHFPPIPPPPPPPQGQHQHHHQQHYYEQYHRAPPGALDSPLFPVAATTASSPFHGGFPGFPGHTAAHTHSHSHHQSNALLNLLPPPPPQQYNMNNEMQR